MIKKKDKKKKKGEVPEAFRSGCNVERKYKVSPMKRQRSAERRP